jgi:hypothetical protein
LTFTLYVDGGGTTEVPCYFSYKCLETEQQYKGSSYNPIQMERFYLVNLSYELLPKGCSIFNADGKMTNNIAEICALTFGLLRFKRDYDYHPVTIFHDSQLIVNFVKGNWQCKAEHLLPWIKAVQALWWPKIDYRWVPRKEIVKVLGH